MSDSLLTPREIMAAVMVNIGEVEKEYLAGRYELANEMLKDIIRGAELTQHKSELEENSLEGRSLVNAICDLSYKLRSSTGDARENFDYLRRRCKIE